MADAVVLASLVARWVAGWFLGGRLPMLPPATPPSDPRGQGGVQTISIVIPARNEAGSLPALLQSLAAQVRSPAEVIVVDDHSIDGTAEIAARAGVVALRSEEIPEGWLGKPWACAQGAALAKGSVIVFLDADTAASPEFLVRLSALVHDTRGLVSVVPYHETRRPYELASALFNLVALMGAGVSSLGARTAVTGAFGPCLAIRVEDYAAIGGHGAVRHDVLDDVALARVCAKQGLPVTIVAGGRDLRYRMYPAGFPQLVEGWGKNFAAGAGATPLPRLLGVVAWMSGLIETGVITAVGMARLSTGHAGPSWPHVLFYVLFAFQLWFLLRRIGNRSAAVALLHPVAGLIFIAIFARSAITHLRGEVTWKHRTIAVGAKRPRRS